MNRHKFKIYKSHGGLEHFSKKKLYSSLKYSGLPHQQCQQIADKVSREVCEGTRTKDIYRKTLQLVKQKSPMAAVQYSLKRAIFELGPTGHYFESFVAKYFEDLGYSAVTCLTFDGRLVKHEVDVVATKGGKRIFVECKFHNRIGIKNDIKIALYVKARWDDLKEGNEGKNLDAFYIASNTAFTDDAITYAQGSGLNLLGINAPVEESFLEQIRSRHLYPITCLKRLSKHVKEQLLNMNIILAKELSEQINVLLKLGMEDEEINHIIAEIEMLKGNIK